ncbi:MAG: UvrD-helicase domain-containing protein, partial [Pirellulales bacterium]
MALHYTDLLHKAGFIDFDDMTIAGLRLLSMEWVAQAVAAKFPVLLVDEYQDLGVQLHHLVRILSESVGVRVIAVGDPDQSIYAFSGAQPTLLRELAERTDFETIALRINYRSRQRIIDAAEIILQEDRGYIAADEEDAVIDFVFCEDGGLAEQAQRAIAAIPEILSRHEGRQVGDIGVLYVDKNVGDVIADVAREHNVRYVRIDGNAPYPKTPLTRWVEDCARWCSGEWRTGNQRIRDILELWGQLTGVDDEADIAADTKANLTQFLWNHRSADLPALDWLNALWRVALEAHL